MAFIATSARYGTGRFGIARYGAEDISKTIAGVSGTGAIQAVAAGGFEIDITEVTSTNSESLPYIFLKAPIVSSRS